MCALVIIIGFLIGQIGHSNGKFFVGKHDGALGPRFERPMPSHNTVNGYSTRVRTLTVVCSRESFPARRSLVLCVFVFTVLTMKSSRTMHAALLQEERGFS